MLWKLVGFKKTPIAASGKILAQTNREIVIFYIPVHL